MNGMSVMKSKRGWLVGMVVAVAVIIHMALVFREYPPDVLVRGEVPLKGDVCRYYATAYGTAHAGGLYGYDPYTMAGYPVGLWNSMGKKGFEVAHILFPWVPLPALFYLVLAGGAILAPLLLWFGLRRFCSASPQSYVLLILSILYWDLDTQLSYFWQFGNVFFPLTAALACIAAGFFWDLLSGTRCLFSALMFAFLSTCVFYCHTVVLVALGLAVLPMLFVKFSALKSARTWLYFALSAFLFAIASLPWFLPLWASRGECVPQPADWWQGGWKNFVMDAFSDRVYRHNFDRNLLLHIAVVFGVAGTALAFLRKNAVVALMGCAGVLILILSYTGSYLGRVAAIQPYRFLQVSSVFFLLPMTVALSWFAGVVKGGSKQIRVALALVLLVSMPAFSGYLLDLAGTRESCIVPGSFMRMASKLNELKPQGRIVCDEAGLAHAIPWICGRPVLGGLSTQAFLKHRFAGVDDEGRIFGRNAAQWAPGLFKQYLDALAVDLAILARADWISFADAPGSPLEHVASQDGYRIYRVRDACPSLVMRGVAKARAEYNMITVTEVAATNLLLKLHYEPWLVADNGVRIEPEQVLDDPVPFIRCVVPSAISQFRIVKE